MKIAVEGCCHGELDNIYGEISRLERQNNYKVDLLLICGDFQAIRNHRDLKCMAVPDKYKRLGEFHKYYTGQKTAPVLTIFIGGNHEASNYLWELYHGGWVAPNIYYLGHAGCVQVNGVRIAGASGIFKPQDYRQGHWEMLPYDKSSMRTIYHVREFDVRRLFLLSSPDIFISHDWPTSITRHGNQEDLLHRKPFFREDIYSGKLGSPPMMSLLMALKPKWWFAAHLHCRFEARVVHSAGQGEGVKKVERVENPDEIVIDEDEDEVAGESGEGFGEEKKKASDNPDEITLDDEEEDVVAPPRPPAVTKFLALDKCLPKRQYLEIVDIDAPIPVQPGITPKLAFDPEWLAITRALQPWFSTSQRQTPFPEEARAREMVKKELAWVEKEVLGTEKGKEVCECQSFVVTAPGPQPKENKNQMPPFYPNPQTDAFCSMLGIENKVNASAGDVPSPQVNADLTGSATGPAQSQSTAGSTADLASAGHQS